MGMKTTVFLALSLMLVGCSFYGVDQNAVASIVYDVYTTTDRIADTREDWKLPDRTLSEGGDCEDLSILALYRIYQQLGVKGTLVVGWIVRVDGSGWHAWISVGGADYDPTLGRFEGTYSRVWEWDYDLVMAVAR